MEKKVKKAVLTPDLNAVRVKFATSPIIARVAPFLVFYALLVFQGSSDTGYFWVYLLKTCLGAWLVWEMRPFVPEMRWAISWEAVLAGVAVFVMWVGIDPYYFKFTTLDKLHNPHELFSPGLAWLFLSVHLLGSTFVVPPLEEVFFRSFLYRYFVNTDFLSMPLNQFHALSFVVTAILFGAEHYQWLAGILCGLAYHGLILRKNRLGDAMTAHAITNFLLGIYVIWRGAWNFW